MEQFLDSHMGEIILGIVGLVASLIAGKYKQKLTEIADVVRVTSDALADDKITPEEMKRIIKEVRDVVGR